MKPLFEIGQDNVWSFWLDSHMISDLTLCPAMFEYKYLAGTSKDKSYKSKGNRIWAIELGSWWSEVMEDYYDAMSENKLNEIEILQKATKHWHERKMDEFATLNAADYLDFVGSVSNSVPLGAITFAKQYFNRYAIEDQKKWRVVATEAGFGFKNEVLVAENNQVRVYLTGRPDQLVVENGVFLMPIDHKTTQRISDKWRHSFKPHGQTIGYIFGTQEISKALGFTNYHIDRCVINGAGWRKPVENPKDKKKPPEPRFDRIYISYTQDEIEEWRLDTLDKVSELRSMMERERFRHAFTTTCHNQYNRPCTFLPVCNKRPKERGIILNSNYQLGERWSPYQVEE